MRQTLTALAAAAAILALAGGCASSGIRHPHARRQRRLAATPAEQQALARYLAYAGPPINQFTWFGRF